MTGKISARACLQPRSARVPSHPLTKGRGISTIPLCWEGILSPASASSAGEGGCPVSKNSSCFPEVVQLARSSPGGAAKEKAHIGCHSCDPRGCGKLIGGRLSARTTPAVTGSEPATSKVVWPCGTEPGSRK